MCLVNARTSILVNGSPTGEFTLFRGLRQGDPLSPFIFLVVMEGLHLCINNKVDSSAISGVKVGKPHINIFHLFYGDDTIILSEWNRDNLANTIIVLNEFYRFSGLKINVAKSHLFGIGVLDDMVDTYVHEFGCSKVSFEKVGLDIESLRAFNYALLFKWIWRLKVTPNTIWANVIKAIHGEHAGMDGSILKFKGIWSNTVDTFHSLIRQGTIPHDILRAKIGNGRSIRFRHDNWLGDDLLMDKYRRLYHLELSKDCSLADRVENNSWVWSWNRAYIGDKNIEAIHDMISKIGQLRKIVGEGLVAGSAFLYRNLKNGKNELHGMTIGEKRWKLRNGYSRS
ncbi:uncharacterized protein [Rutidosis leptorrhynchoides]|uniref:uncharacterized protein n=1 Tax=Rutidosis leptorrhynchoides TaxID=125765 RepID=UPI003A998A73